MPYFRSCEYFQLRDYQNQKIELNYFFNYSISIKLNLDDTNLFFFYILLNAYLAHPILKPTNILLCAAESNEPLVFTNKRVIYRDIITLNEFFILWMPLDLYQKNIEQDLHLTLCYEKNLYLHMAQRLSIEPALLPITYKPIVHEYSQNFNTFLSKLQIPEYN